MDPGDIATLRSFLFPVTVISDPGFYMFYFFSSVRSVKEQNKDQKQKSLSLSLTPRPSKKQKNEKQKHSSAVYWLAWKGIAPEKNISLSVN